MLNDTRGIPELDEQFARCRAVNSSKSNDSMEKECALFRKMHEERLPASAQYEPFVLRMEGALLFNCGKFEEAIGVFERLIGVTQSLGDVVSESMANLGLCNCLNSLERYQEALSRGERSVHLLKDVDDPESLLFARGGLFSSYMFLGEYQRAERELIENIDLARKLGLEKIELQLMSNLFAPYFYMGEVNSALRSLFAAHDMAIKRQEEGMQIQAAGNISFLATQIGAFDMARRWAEPVLKYNKRVGNRRESLNTLINIDFLEFEADKTLEKFNTLVENVDSLLNTPYAVIGAEMTAHIIETYLKQEMVNEAREFVERWHSKVHEIEFSPATQSFERAALAVRVRCGETDNAMDDCESLLAQARESKVAKEQEHLLSIRSSLHRESGDLEAAITDLTEYFEIRIKNEQQLTMYTAAAMEAEREHEQLHLVSEKQQDLLSSVMPDEIVERLMKGEENIADLHDDASVMFLDLVSFTDLSSSVPPAHLIHLLNAVFSTCDDVVQEHGLTKIKTIGDSYMAVSGIPHAQEDHAQRMANAAAEMTKRLKDLQVLMPEELGDTSWVDAMDDLSIRIGLHCGPVVAGVIGKHRAQYDVWGDTVNTAARMESSGEPDRIHVSEDFAMKVADGAIPEIDGIDIVIKQAPFQMRLRGTQKIKGKGDMKTFWLEGM